MVLSNDSNSNQKQIMITMYDYIMVCEQLSAEYGCTDVEQIKKQVLNNELMLVSMIGLKQWLNQRN